MSRGQECRIYFSSADASTAARLTLYTADGVILASTRAGAGSGVEMGANARLNITDLHIVTGAITGDLFSDHNNDGNVDAGESMIKIAASIAARYQFLSVPLTGLAGDLPKIKTSGAGQIDVVGTGYLTTV